MNVLSLFDGMSCGNIALERAGIQVNNYYASEIDKPAIQVAQHNYPNTIQLGSIIDLNEEYLKTLDIDMVIGGSPCQGFSMSGKLKGSVTKCGKEVTTLEQYLILKEMGFEFDGQSYLFWEYIRVLRAVSPKYFLLENVKVTNKWKGMFNNAVGVDPILINSTLVSAQNRNRYYWTNIPNISHPTDKNITLSEVIEQQVEGKYYLSDKAKVYITDNTRIKKRLTSINGDKASCLMAQYNQSKNGTFLCVDANGRIDDKKTGTLTQRYYKGVENYGSSPYLYDGKYRKFTPTECERLQTVPDGYTSIVSDTQRYKMLGNGWTVDVVAHLFKNIVAHRITVKEVA